MCGIAGRFHPEALPDAPGWADRASTLLAHRGPDGAGCFQDHRAELVHRRLALIDLSPSGRQPMANEDGSVEIVFNGEIYNHRELRHELEDRGHVFRSTTDTEVVVHLYEEMGDRLVDRLRGIFAFAIYDRNRCSLLMARDRFGVKPLFYAMPGDQWIFASEIKAITALPGFRPKLDHQACYDFLSLGYIPEPATGFHEIAALPKGTTLTVAPGIHRFVQYHRASARPEQSTRIGDAEETIADRMLEAVGRQSLADVPVAALLSGGIDSSLVVAAHGKATGTSTRTFNVRFPDPRHDETGMAHTVARHFGTRHHTIDASDNAITPDAVMDLLRHFDQPFADTSFIPMYWVAKGVRDQGIICALSGDGGDEAFGGYSTFWRASRLMKMVHAPAWARRAARFAGRVLTGRTKNFGRQLAKAVRLAEDGRDDSSIILSGFASYLSEEQKAELVNAGGRDNLLPTHRHFDGHQDAACTDIEELSRRMTESLFQVSLPSDMLRKVDMMSMRASIEVRVPLLDEDVVDYGLTLPHRLKTDGKKGKLVLRRLASRWLPRSTARHPKHGFSIPLDVLAPPAFHEALEDLLCWPDARTRPFVNGPLVRRWLAAFRNATAQPRGGAISREGLYERIIMLLSLELWMRDHNLTW